MNIQPIVEGHGEVEAIPILLRRLLAEAQVYGVDVNRPLRGKRSQLVREDTLRATVRVALKQKDCAALLIIFDADDDCPATVVSVVQKWAQDESGDLPCYVVLSNREYEAWFLGSIESLRGRRGIRQDATSHPSPESIRDCKGKLEDRMEGESPAYTETGDQPALTALFDMAAAHRACRSFRRMTRAFGLILSDLGKPIRNWPPQTW